MPESDLDRFEQLLGIQRRLSGERNVDQLSKKVMNEVAVLLDADRSSLFLFDWKVMQLRACFAEGVPASSIVVPLKMGIMGSSVLMRRTINISNAYAHPYFNLEIDGASKFKTESVLATPIQSKEGRLLGGIELLNRAIGRFTETDAKLVEEESKKLAE